MTDASEPFITAINEELTRATADFQDQWWGAIVGNSDGPGPQGILAAVKHSAYLPISDELIHPENYPTPPTPPWHTRARSWIRSAPNRGRRAVGFWIAGHDPDEDDEW